MLSKAARQWPVHAAAMQRRGLRQLVCKGIVITHRSYDVEILNMETADRSRELLPGRRRGLLPPSPI
jgi:hypothetical protein